MTRTKEDQSHAFEAEADDGTACMLGEATPEGKKGCSESLQAPLKASGRAHANECAHQQPEVQCRRVNQNPLQDIRASTEVHSPHATSFVCVCEGSLQPLATLAQQTSSPHSTNPSSITVHGLARYFFALPVPPASVGFRNVCADVQLGQILEYLVAVIPLVRHQLLDPITLRACLLNVLGRRRERLFDRLRITFVRGLHRDGHDRAGLQINGVLGLVSQMRGPVLQLRDAGIRVVRVRPVIIGGLLRPFVVDPRLSLLKTRSGSN